MNHCRNSRCSRPRRGWAILTATAVACVWALGGSIARCQPTSSIPFNQLTADVGISPQLGRRLPLDLAFVDADGRDVQLADLFGDRPVILHLVYYQCPMLCKLSSDGLLRALDTLSLRPGEDFSIVTLSFDPREGRELSARARQVAAERVGRAAVERGWQFLTGDEATIATLCDAAGFRYKFDEQTGQFAHAAGVFVLTTDGTISRFLSGVDFSPRDVRLAIVEASDGKVGTATDQVLLMCYMYDPATGRYGMTIITLVRAGGIVTVGLMAAAIMLMIRRERRQHSSGILEVHPGGVPANQ